MELLKAIPKVTSALHVQMNTLYVYMHTNVITYTLANRHAHHTKAHAEKEKVSSIPISNRYH